MMALLGYLMLAVLVAAICTAPCLVDKEPWWTSLIIPGIVVVLIGWLCVVGRLINGHWPGIF